jgi:hypothetical protein
MSNNNINPMIYGSNDNAESLLIFNPREEAILDGQFPEMLSMSQNKFMKEALEHM